MLLRDASIWRGGSGETSPPPQHPPAAPYLADEPLPVALAPLGKLHHPEYFSRFSRLDIGRRGDFQPRLSRSVCLAASLLHCGCARQVRRSDTAGENRTSGTAPKSTGSCFFTFIYRLVFVQSSFKMSRRNVDFI